ncbi:hypothetical protein C8J56DRAFT_949318 [Mycena floridula]|nr:hypothetical protein C8J56DRAFT_949318 [Mycena floridula]
MTTLEGSDSSRTLLVVAAGARHHIFANMSKIAALMATHGVDATTASIQPGFDEALLRDSVGFLQKIFVVLTSPISSPKEFASALGEILSPYPASIHLLGSILFSPVFKPDGSEWHLDELVQAQTVRVTPGLISVLAPASIQLASAPASSSSSNALSQQGTGSGQEKDRDRGGRQEGDDDGQGSRGGPNEEPGANDPNPEPPHQSADLPPGVHFRSTAKVVFSPKYTQNFAIEGWLSSKPTTKSTCGVDFTHLRTETQHLSVGRYKHHLTRVTVNTNCGPNATSRVASPQTTTKYAATTKQTSVAETGHTNLATAAGKGIFAGATVELTGSTSKTTKSVTAVEKVENMEKIILRQPEGIAEWQFFMVDPQHEDNGHAFSKVNLPSVEFEMIGRDTPPNLYVEVAAYWSIPIQETSPWMAWRKWASQEDIPFQNLVHLIAMKIPSAVTSRSDYIAIVHRLPESQTTEKVLTQGGPDAVCAVAIAENDDHFLEQLLLELNAKDTKKAGEEGKGKGQAKDNGP